MSKDLHPLLKGIIPLVEGIANTFGKNCEVVLHDIRNPQSSVIAIANGHITGRSIGSPMTEYGLATLRSGQFDKPIVNYRKKTKDGKLLKSSSLFIKDENGKLIGFLCINYDISELTIARNIINNLTNIIEETDFSEEDESFGNTVNEMLSSIVNKTLESVGKPVAFISKEEKVNIVQMLDEKGVFLIKGAIDYVAKVLCVSRYTVYNYLDETRVND
ncbi:MAG TPA: PAS domain-containing protein [Bacillota bacterium]|mgnify:FL=1|jgi:predicted transcriptional regulator YheO|nr:PAS domain-containing protein [Bacillota bacterium]HRS22496.1 PAS domain-containing protein [Clostridia bacterium]HRU40575.1 PAS domain-containing protein [Candidatus Diapherotrites archaeon]HQE65580.1 PAS domain-containing protein [Bacillota bacterium]HQI16093.1 PAS domain-containing protein [Bacillota bacterium]